MIDHHSVLRAECALVSTLARSAPHDASIGHLPGWTVHDVIAHLTGDYLWVLDTLATRRRPRVGLVAVDTRGDALCDEWDGVSARLVDELDGADPDEPCPNFAVGAAGTLGWHIRHQALETMIHRWDVESVTGDHAPIDDTVAADGVTELLEVYTQRYGGQVLDRPITLACPGGDGWAIAPAAEVGRVAVTVRRVAAADADIVARPAELVLLLWHRIGVDDPRIRYGSNADAARAFVGGPLTA